MVFIFIFALIALAFGAGGIVYVDAISEWVGVEPFRLVGGIQVGALSVVIVTLAFLHFYLPTPLRVSISSVRFCQLGVFSSVIPSSLFYFSLFGTPFFDAEISWETSALASICTLWLSLHYYKMFKSDYNDLYEKKWASQKINVARMSI
jgi:hypothetical protein